MLALSKGSRAVPDSEFQAQEGHHIVGLSIRILSQWALLRHQWMPLSAAKNVSGASGTTYVSEIITNTTSPLIIHNICFQKCVTFISQHLSYALYAFLNSLHIIMHTTIRRSTPDYLNNICLSPPAPHFYRQMLALRGPFERGAPRSPIANFRGKKATTFWLCP